MVRFSITMDNVMTGTIDTTRAKKKISRSDWITEACTPYLSGGNGSGKAGKTTLRFGVSVMNPDGHPLDLLMIRGLTVKAFIMLKPGLTPSDSLIREILNHGRKVTAPYKYPHAIEYVASLPTTISGKIRRNELRIRVQKKFQSETRVQWKE